jgi:hypothetical protein
VLQYYTPVDLTGYEARIQIRNSRTDTVVWEGGSETSGMTVDTAEYLITLRIPPDDLAEIEAGRYVYEIEMYNGTDVHQLVEGTFLLDREVAVDA